MKMEIDSVRWKARFPNADVDAGKAHDEIERIRSKNQGKITDDLLIDAAKSKRNVLHNLFEWDDTKAAHEHRRSQARGIIRALEITYKERPEEPTRAYEVVHKRVPKADAKNQVRTLYSSQEEAVKDSKSREALMAEAIQQLMAWRRRFRLLNEFDRLFEQIDEAIEQKV